MDYKKIVEKRLGRKVGKSLRYIFWIIVLMKSKKKGILALASIVAMLTVVSITGIPESNAAQAKMYEVTITNLTPGQPITPPLLVTHSYDAGIFSVGEMAS